MEWLNHELDMYVVTNNRIIWIEQVAFLNRVVSECNLAQIQEVNSSTQWLFSNILNYGTLTLQTAGRGTHFTMEFCPDILNCSRAVLNVVDTYRDASPSGFDSLGQKKHPHAQPEAEEKHEK
jgi:Bacterial PH domain